MLKNLANSRIDRQNILNNDLAIKELQTTSGINGILWEEKIFVTKESAANYFQVDIRTISRYIEQNCEELTTNGYEVLRGKRLKDFIFTAQNSGEDINVPTKTTVLSLFDFKAFLNLAMLISESKQAKFYDNLCLMWLSI